MPLALSSLFFIGKLFRALIFIRVFLESFIFVLNFILVFNLGWRFWLMRPPFKWLNVFFTHRLKLFLLLRGLTVLSIVFFYLFTFSPTVELQFSRWNEFNPFNLYGKVNFNHSQWKLGNTQLAHKIGTNIKWHYNRWWP